MITCQHTRQLFDRYLDDELSPSLQAELHAHVINCTPCQNHLALLEACGDVIRLDKCEPGPSPSFADRVLAARREQAAVPGRAVAGGWGRLGWRIGGPLAAAASIVLIMTVGTPVFDGRPVSTPHTVVGGAQWAAPKPVQENLKKLAMTKLDPQAEAELKNTPEMKALPFLEVLLNPVVEGASNAVAGAHQSYEDAQLLVRYLFAGANERLVAELRQKYPDIPPQEAERVISDLDILKNALPPELPVEEPPNAEAAPSNSAPSNTPASPDAI
jgi:hypothetical protein